MKRRFYIYATLTMAFSIIMLTNCDNNNSTGTKPEQVVNPSPQSNPSPQPNPTPSPQPDPTVNSVTPIRTFEYFQKLLDEFCKAYFEVKGEGRIYTPSSISVREVNTVDNKTYEVNGEFSYKGKGLKGPITGNSYLRKDYHDMEFSANIIDQEDEDFLITFNWNEKTKSLSLGNNIAFKNKLNQQTN